MTTKSLSALNAQIQELQQQADALKKQADELRSLERAGVIEELKAKISEYGLTAGDLRLGASTKAAKRAFSSKSATKAAPKYRSANGEEWSGGRGRKPHWVTEALAAGKELTQFEIK